jgi:toxin ParE1/3/4
MASYRVRESASSDLYEIGLEMLEAWDDASAVERYLAQLVDAFDSLAVMPELGKACDEVGRGWRCLPGGEHLIYYKLTAEQIVDIVRVLHMRMDPDRLLDDQNG